MYRHVYRHVCRHVYRYVCGHVPRRDQSIIIIISIHFINPCISSLFFFILFFDVKMDKKTNTLWHISACLVLLLALTVESPTSVLWFLCIQFYINVKYKWLLISFENPHKSAKQNIYCKRIQKRKRGELKESDRKWRLIVNHITKMKQRDTCHRYRTNDATTTKETDRRIDQVMVQIMFLITASRTNREATKVS